MPAVMETIDRMPSDEKVKTMEYLWPAMTATAEPESLAWHADVLAERRRRVAVGEGKFIPLKRRCASCARNLHAGSHSPVRQGRLARRLPFLRKAGARIRTSES